MLKKNIKDFKKHLNDYLLCEERYKNIEIDFEKIDKSQLQMCHELEMAFWSLLGMDEYLLSIWKTGHFDTSATDFIAGVKAYIMYQRRSGDASTCFANTLISMLAIVRSVNLEALVCTYFVGDDSNVFLHKDVSMEDIMRNLSEIFNLSAKLIEKTYAYMCSNFIIPTHEAYFIIPDPVKRMERLGKHLYVTDEKDIRERFVSFSDMMQGLNYSGVKDRLIYALSERYGTSGYTAVAIDALRTLSTDYNEFRKLYKKEKRKIYNSMLYIT
jgi:hypothetical protein